MVERVYKSAACFLRCVKRALSQQFSISRSQVSVNIWLCLADDKRATFPLTLKEVEDCGKCSNSDFLLTVMCG